MTVVFGEGAVAQVKQGQDPGRLLAPHGTPPDQGDDGAPPNRFLLFDLLVHFFCFFGLSSQHQFQTRTERSLEVLQIIKSSCFR